jgi:hydroxymethylpyrimidine/phosphomethylpyrimidine kinase
MKDSAVIPVVLALAGLDPSGGAGLQADIEAIGSMGCHAAAIATCLTVQDTCNVHEVQPTDPALLVAQTRAVLEDMPVKAVKIGLLPDVPTVEAIHSILRDYGHLPVILDPVLAAGGGARLVSNSVRDAIINLLLPQTYLLTPNSLEALQLATAADNIESSAYALLEAGCEYVLITGGHETTDEVINQLYSNHRLLKKYHWPRLPGSFHGSGCTLSAASAALLAQGQEPLGAIYAAQRYTWNTLKNAYRAGMGQQIPDRFFWAHPQLDEQG